MFTNSVCAEFLRFFLQVTVVTLTNVAAFFQYDCRQLAGSPGVIYINSTLYTIFETETICPGYIHVSLNQIARKHQLFSFSVLLKR